ncbi:neuronal acetylcholine receptor subunit beta-3-like [Mya arenaria]|uniref:neuronal acetylcholine receptor subunit beta-3-like n=1 Tax=Mya arenaria TaxID=6604 RepID=UPI0022E11F55|nr:neuronal acetylcholine receptor subunit beta-3-like [Mya arenaria]
MLTMNVLLFVFIYLKVVQCLSDPLGYVPPAVGLTTLSYDEMEGLFTDLFFGYDKTIRPRHQQGDVVKVGILFTPQSITSLDTTQQVLTMTGHFRVVWQDHMLTWDSHGNGGTTELRQQLGKIWYPGLHLDRALDNRIIGDPLDDTVRILDNGNVTWMPSGSFSFQCDADVRYYPFDKQTCTMVIYPAAVNIAVSMEPEDVNLAEFTENGEWELVETSSKVVPVNTVDFVRFAFTLKRRTGFVAYTMIFPLACLSVINSVSFLVPVESGEKGCLSITVFLAYAFFITYVTNMLPHNTTPEISLYIKYLSVILFFSVAHYVYVCAQSRIHHCYGGQPCSLLKKMRYKTKRKVGQAQKQADDRKLRLNGNEEITWTEFLRRLDVFMFCFSMVCLAVISASFVVVMNSNA